MECSTKKKETLPYVFVIPVTSDVRHCNRRGEQIKNLLTPSRGWISREVPRCKLPVISIKHLQLHIKHNERKRKLLLCSREWRK
ncbi:hypothetical protein Y032_0272g924 [Ancylostoma ceylanicum]|uniref:Uncharacterized protein n=1 Tax=Ancylostoma ceylanicum TaxID=53326 RepID=A0A016S8N0_9BILA|nr:hypothetical protein Y032_0272g924 [Ancylostoma ceylanicum]